MSVSAQNLFNRTYHKVPRKIEVFLKVTAAADVDASGYTINYGSDLVSTVVKNTEGVMDITPSFPITDLVGLSVVGTQTTAVTGNFTSVTTGASPLVKITFNDNSDATTNGAATDPDSNVIFVTMVFNTSGVATK